MHFFRSLSLRAQLMLVVIVIVLAGFALTLTVLTRQAAQLQEGTALDYAQEVASRDGNAAATRLRQALETAHTLADALQGLQQSGHANRAQGIGVIGGSSLTQQADALVQTVAVFQLADAARA